MKKWLVLLTLCFTFISGTVAMASEKMIAPQGILTNEDGDTIVVEGILIEDKATPFALNENELIHEQTYMYNIEPRANHTDTIEDSDIALVTTAYLTIKYHTTSDNLYILDEVSGYWTSPTDSARITESTVDYACIRLGNESQRKYGVDVDNYFEISTGFTVGVPDWTVSAL